MRPLRIFTPVFGPKHIDLFNRALVNSLAWPRNQKALNEARARWMLYVNKAEAQTVQNIIARVVPPERHEILIADESLDQMIKHRGDLTNTAFGKGISKCLQDTSQMLISTVDFIWGDGSIPNMLAAANQNEVCVSIPHPRVLPEILIRSELLGPLTNYQLCSLAMKYPHRSWSASEYGQNPSGTHVGGILWRKIRPGVITLQHRMPSPYLCNFIGNDYEFFMTKNDQKSAGWGAIDHDFPVKLLNEQRLRMILSSDAAFMAEVTDPDANMPPLHPFNGSEPDSFWLQDRKEHLLNHKINRQYIATFRFEP